MTWMTPTHTVFNYVLAIVREDRTGVVHDYHLWMTFDRGLSCRFDERLVRSRLRTRVPAVRIPRRREP